MSFANRAGRVDRPFPKAPRADTLSVMGISVRRTARRFRFAPGTGSGWFAVGALGLTAALLAARIVLTPAIGLPLNYLVVFLAAAVSGLVALYAVALSHERSASVVATLVVGLGAAAWLLAESLGGESSNVTTLGEADNGSTITVTQGAGIMIQLPGNPTTGYDWQANVGSSGIVTPTGSTYKPSSSALGSGGTYTFTFAASSQGTTVVTLTYQRAWETGVAPLRTYTVTIVVR